MNDDREVRSQRRTLAPLWFSSSTCRVALLSGLVGKDHDSRRMRFGIDQFQLYPVLEVLKERLAASSVNRLPAGHHAESCGKTFLLTEGREKRYYRH